MQFRMLQGKERDRLMAAQYFFLSASLQDGWQGAAKVHQAAQGHVLQPPEHLWGKTSVFGGETGGRGLGGAVGVTSVDTTIVCNQFHRLGYDHFN
eukprot:s912_g3.t1